MRNLTILAAAVFFMAAPAFAADLVTVPGGAAKPTDPAQPMPAFPGRNRVYVFNLDKTGDVQMHLEGIDNIVVLDGDATLVTGGDMAGGHMVNEGEFRATGLSGDTKTTEIHKDDIIQIPAGMPQWIKPHGHIRYVTFRAPGQKD
jgi:hypothetical protein